MVLYLSLLSQLSEQLRCVQVTPWTTFPSSLERHVRFYLTHLKVSEIKSFHHKFKKKLLQGGSLIFHTVNLIRLINVFQNLPVEYCACCIILLGDGVRCCRYSDIWLAGFQRLFCSESITIMVVRKWQIQRPTFYGVFLGFLSHNKPFETDFKVSLEREFSK